MLLEKQKKLIIEALCWQIEALLLPLFFIYTFIMHAVKKATIQCAIVDLKLGLKLPNWNKQCMNYIHGNVNKVVFKAMYVTMHVV
jgi:hypothetical protein